MGPISAEITIDAPREQVYAIIADLGMRPAFCDHFMEEFRLQRIAATGVGAAARYRVGAPRFPIWLETVIAELEPPHLILERGKGSRIDRMPVGTDWELISRSGTMTDVTVSFWTEPRHPIDKLKDRASSARWYERQWKRALMRLRDLVEADAEIRTLQVAGASHP
ncbi:MAG: SRPBCC family protein [Solirubrobacterales bacterium]|nr:SRPBCC family protein [Solirubrobacterales bacterium]